MLFLSFLVRNKLNLSCINTGKMLQQKHLQQLQTHQFISYLGSLDFALINRNELNLSCFYTGEMLLGQCLQLQQAHPCLFLTLAPWTL